MQKVEIKIKDPKTGSEEMQTRQVHRCWQDGTRQVWLHADGTYGDKSGAPVREEGELDIIEDPKQYKRALRWWNTRGKELALDLYGADEEPDDDDIEDAYYISYPAGASPDEPQPGEDWLSLGFKRRPEWWGSARVIEIDGQVFELEEPEEEPDPTPEVKPKAAKKEDKNPIDF